MTVVGKTEGSKRDARRKVTKEPTKEPTKKGKKKLVSDETVKRQLGRLRRLYPDADCALKHRDAFQLLIATILSAQCTDKAVNKVTPALFEAFPTPDALGRASQEEVEALIRSIGLYRNKAKNIRATARIIADEHGGNVPRTMENLTALKGVARKTANVVLGTAFGMAEGVVVDTHVKRISNLLGFVDADNPVKVERALMERVPRRRWIRLSHELILHGRQVCTARNPDCEHCKLAPDCPGAQIG